MNIYISVEVSVRELDSKLLLGILAASKGHCVIISDLKSILRGVRKNILPPGIFHTKSLTPTNSKIKRHQELIDKGFLITSIDEEAGLDIFGYKEFSKTRYSEKTIKQSSKVFGWGDSDTKVLKKEYFKYKSKIIKTGSPRVDLWKPEFSKYWSFSRKFLKRPYLLISSNMGYGNNNLPFNEIFKKKKLMGYYQRFPELIDKDFGRVSENYLTTREFVKAIEFISKNNNSYDIVLRPHPSENIDIWKTYLNKLPNVHIINSDSITAWINSSFAVMHNGCTTAIEAIISNKPLLTYVPYSQEFSSILTNKLGFKIKTKEKLLKKINEIFKNRHKSKKSDNRLPNLLLNKIFIDNKELSAIKIVKEWETLNSSKLSKSFNFTKLKLQLKLEKFKQVIARSLRVILPSRFSRYNYSDNKFKKLNKKDILSRFKSMKKILNINDKVSFEIISEKTIIISKF